MSQDLEKQDIEEIVDQVFERLTLSKDQINQAKANWSELIGLFEYGFDDEGPLISRYSQIKRLCNEAEEIIAEHGTGDSQSTSYALDPHIISSYAELTEEQYDNDLNFLDNEWDYSKDVSKDEYCEFLYSALFREPKFYCTESAREEIAHHYSYLHSYQTKEKARDLPRAEQISDLKQREKSAMALATQIEDMVTRKKTIERFSFKDEQINNFVQDRFNELVSTSTARGLSNRFALIRFQKAMGGCKLIMGLSHFKDKLNDRELNSVREILSVITKRTAENQAAKNRLWSANKIFEKLRYGRGRDTSSGTEFNLNAIFEINTLNVIFELLGIDHNLKYLSPSSRVFTFLSGFPQGAINCKMVHPRNYFYFERAGEFENYRPQFEMFVSSFSAFTNRIRSIDGKVSANELEDFKDKFSENLNVLRDVSSFLATADENTIHATGGKYGYVPHAVNNYFDALNKTYEELGHPVPDYSAKAIELIGELSGTLEIGADKSREGLRKLFEDTQDSIIKSIEEITLQNEENTREENSHKLNHIAVRTIRKKNGTTSERLTCIPLNGGYRYMFSIHNSQILELLDGEVSDKPKIYKTTEFLELVRTDCERLISSEGATELEKLKASALKKFIRGFYAASHKDWRLADVIATQAIDEMGQSELNVPRAHLIKQELLFFVHFMKRAAAQQAPSITKKMKLLSQASVKLNESSKLSIGLKKEDLFYSSEVNPLSIKQALAMAGLKIEWLVGATELNRRQLNFFNYNNIGMLQGLPKTMQNDLVWSESSIFSNTISAKMTEQEIIISCDGLEVALQGLMENIITAINSLNGVTHSKVFWQYLVTRCFGMLRFLQICREVGFLPQGEKIDISKQWSEYFHCLDGFVESMLNAEQDNDSSYDYIESPLNGALQSLRDLEEAKRQYEENSEKIDKYEHVAEMLRALGNLDNNCYRLQTDGLPRSVFRAVKKRYASKLIEDLDDVSSMIKNTIIQPDIWAGIE